MRLHTSIHLSPLVLSLLLVQLLFQFLQPKKKKISYDEEKFLVPQPFFVYVILDYIFIILGNK